ncbi:RNA-binding protein NOB1 isoform X2 [Pundamilia nyererei]|uniref:RNA-binding protein NOB1 n=1 Tax=Pundamilia nyererei TaxID=303518 RepID=A0A3B4GMX4_9CICH|nr:PREDICTED: RNA-binding protein NOB1 isoform X2 [Pundamilia nyererei]XP_014191280.1 RNA-binding protein NOB1 isoform X2 [Haplochromis burtoni]XP_039867861.1 RNA-binding protein NOB1 isoform X2 [Simochromis diagramma]
MATTLVEHVVADAGAFLRKAPLQEIGRNIYTLKDVVEEIRDKPTRRSLAFLPYQLHFKEPHPEHIRHVTEFSKKTGDYPSLSATDIKVLALTYQLELENVGSQHLRKEPEVKVNIQSTQRHPETPMNVAGFHFPSKKPADSTNVQQTETEKKTPNETDGDEFNSFQFWREPLPAIDDELLGLLKEGNESPQTEKRAEQRASAGQSDDEDKENEPDDEDDEEDDDDGGGWITPGNIKEVKMDSADWTAPADIKVGCLTTDFAMQNVLIQIGLHVLSVNGMLIKQARNYILRCHACFKTTSDMNKAFCPHCGNRTLKKLAVTVNEDGSVQMHFSKNPKVLNPRGLRHTLPLPQGGKHSTNPHLVEDQRFPQQRLSRKARQKTDVFNPDYVAGASPFCENDIYSRAANLQIRDSQCGGGRRRANPNATRRKFIKKK